MPLLARCCHYAVYAAIDAAIVTTLSPFSSYAKMPMLRYFSFRRAASRHAAFHTHEMLRYAFTLSLAAYAMLLR